MHALTRFANNLTDLSLTKIAPLIGYSQTGISTFINRETGRVDTLAVNVVSVLKDKAGFDTFDKTINALNAFESAQTFEDGVFAGIKEAFEKDNPSLEIKFGYKTELLKELTKEKRAHERAGKRDKAPYYTAKEAIGKVQIDPIADNVPVIAIFNLEDPEDNTYYQPKDIAKLLLKIGTYIEETGKFADDLSAMTF